MTKEKKKNAHLVVKKLQKDLKKLSKDWENLLSKKKQADDREFLQEVAQDIKNLSDDTVIAESDQALDSSVELIENMLTTPWGAPFVSDTTLLEAAIRFEFQKPEESDLFNLMSSFSVYSTVLSNQFLTIIDSLSEDLENH